jgi:XTP/dITP diphosphohydrolase
VIVIASRNRGKVREIAALPGAAGLELKCIADYDGCPDVPEDGTAFEENAVIKAVKYSLWLKRAHGSWPPVVAEDSGLSVEGLLGWPGVHSARIAASPGQRIDEVLRRAEGLASRAARFTAVTAVALNGVLLRTFTAHVQGQLTETRRGDGGFGYDPIFEDPATGKTFAQLDAAEKNAISHRGKSWERLFDHLRSAGLAETPAARRARTAADGD